VNDIFNSFRWGGVYSGNAYRARKKFKNIFEIGFLGMGVIYRGDN